MPIISKFNFLSKWFYFERSGWAFFFLLKLFYLYCFWTAIQLFNVAYQSLLQRHKNFFLIKKQQRQNIHLEFSKISLSPLKYKYSFVDLNKNLVKWEIEVEREGKRDSVLEFAFFSFELSICSFNIRNYIPHHDSLATTYREQIYLIIKPLRNRVNG